MAFSKHGRAGILMGQGSKKNPDECHRGRGVKVLGLMVWHALHDANNQLMRKGFP